jgi:hypothetical protein
MGEEQKALSCKNSRKRKLQIRNGQMEVPAWLPRRPPRQPVAIFYEKLNIV